jgi:hypothetical protein
MTRPNADSDPEILAISAVYAALKDLEQSSQARVINYVSLKLGVEPPKTRTESESKRQSIEETQESKANEVSTDVEGVEADDLDEVSPIAKKWMARNGLNATSLSAVFSLGIGEIDIVAKSVPGKSKREKTHNIFLLKGAAAYLADGAPRFTHEQVKETCLHYGAFDATNFSVHFKSFIGDVGGTKETGYTLTARGLNAAADLVKGMTRTQPIEK